MKPYFSSICKTAMTLGAAAGCLLMAADAASAFVTNYTQPNGAKGDTTLDSVMFGTKEITDFVVVDQVFELIREDYEGGNTGAASSDKGDNATVGVVEEDPEEADTPLLSL